LREKVGKEREKAESEVNQNIRVSRIAGEKKGNEAEQGEDDARDA
jgi:hypothetical protein